MVGLLQVIVSALVTGSLYAGLLAGLLLVYQVSKAVNFAHGAVGMIAAFLSYTLFTQMGMPLIAAIVLGLIVAAALSLGTYLFVLKTDVSKPEVAGLDLILTLGVMLLIAASAEFFLGSTTYSYPDLGTEVATPIGPIFFNLNQLVGTLVIIAMLIGVVWFAEKSRFGLSLRATASDRELAQSIGINTVKINTWTWIFAGVSAGVVGILVASRLSVSAHYMTPFLVSAMIAGMLGGFDRIVRPLLICFLLALFEGVVTYYIGTNYATPAVFLVLILLLAFLPKRFLAEKGTVRA